MQWFAKKAKAKAATEVEGAIPTAEESPHAEGAESVNPDAHVEISSTVLPDISELEIQADESYVILG